MFVHVVYRLPDSNEYGSKPYTYVTKLPLKVGDKVLAPTWKGKTPAKVTEINVPESRIDERYIGKLQEITEYLPVSQEAAP